VYFELNNPKEKRKLNKKPRGSQKGIKGMIQSKNRYVSGTLKE